MPTRNVVLTDHQDGIIGDLVASAADVDAYLDSIDREPGAR
jgi:hypothetical protein